jgi:hypothetical protein
MSLSHNRAFRSSVIAARSNSRLRQIHRFQVEWP